MRFGAKKAKTGSGWLPYRILGMEFEIRGGYPRRDFKAAWTRHRRLSLISSASYLVIPALMVVGWLIQRPIKIPEFAGTVAITVCFLSFVVLRLTLALFRCPRCGRGFYFYWGGWGHNPFARKCGNCGLRKWDCDPASYDLARLREAEF
jgi:hypothetical protein